MRPEYVRPSRAKRRSERLVAAYFLVAVAAVFVYGAVYLSRGDDARFGVDRPLGEPLPSCRAFD